MRKTGFTLIEIIIALTIVFTILSVAYATYFATFSSVEQCRTKIDTAYQARTLLAKLSRQIRCIYRIPDNNLPVIEPKSDIRTRIIPNASYSFLEAPADKNNGYILSLVTTAAVFNDKLLPHGPFQVVYKYDPDLETLFYSQKKYLPITENRSDSLQQGFNLPLINDATDESWFPLAKNISRIDLYFYDDGKWLSHWSYNEKLQLPKAVKIELTLENINSNSTTFTTSVFVNCS
ncbi:MAG: prepilin-type N-terminal cleavage/methylation domain-containing protein [Sedimentisphaerales bacterium]|nr:prepilin-type N-terminal cleavage/methylation domain-containing protein [Sedimentisphaerales bacterium]